MRTFGRFLPKWLLSLLVLTLCDALIGVYLAVFDQIPTIAQGLPVRQLTSVAHPYKAYAPAPGTRFYGKDSTPFTSPLTGKALRYQVGDEGTVIDDLGHQVLPKHLKLFEEKRRTGEFRILFLGGSTTFLPWPFYVAELLSDRFDHKLDFVSISASNGGYTSQENVIDLLISGFSYTPDLVVAYLPVNDIYWAAHYQEFKRDYTHMRVPFQVYDKSGAEPPKLALHSYPFTLKFYEVVRYRMQLAAYQRKADLAYYTTRQPDHNGELVMDRSSFDQTVEAVIDNIFTMKNECAARGVPFVLVTQKLFPTKNAYYTFMDQYTYQAIDAIKRDKRLTNVQILEMSKAFPDSIDQDTLGSMGRAFHRTFEPDEEAAYDSMHFSPKGNYLFAMILGDFLEPHIRKSIEARLNR